LSHKILVVDDEKTLCDLLSEVLSRAGYSVSTAGSVKGARSVLETSSYDLIVLDVMMPGENGFDLLRWLRNEKRDRTPTILLTAISTEQDKLLAFELEADDYVTKPFSLPEFVARIRAIMRRAAERSNPPEVISFGRCTINRTSRQAFRDGALLKLRPKEYQVLVTLAESPDKAFSRHELFKTIWGEDSPSGEKTVDVTIHTLRDKVEEDPAQPLYIQTVRGYGYRFNPADEKEGMALGLK
jgi:two-component system alkaline phosphatase synthesis response regulator PhoP